MYITFVVVGAGAVALPPDRPLLSLTGVPRSQETASPWDPTVGPCLGPYGGSRGGGVPMGKVPL